MTHLFTVTIFLCFALSGQVPLRRGTEQDGALADDLHHHIFKSGSTPLHEALNDEEEPRVGEPSDGEFEPHIPGALENEEYRLIKMAARAIVRRLSLPSPPALNILIDQAAHFVLKRTLVLEYAKVKSGIHELVMIALNPEKVHLTPVPTTDGPPTTPRVRMEKFLTALEELLQEIIVRNNLTTSQAKKIIRIAIDVLSKKLNLSSSKREGLDERVTSHVRSRLQWEDEDNKDARLRRLEESVEEDLERYHLSALKLKRLEALKVEEEALKEQLSKEEKARMLKRVYADVVDDLREQKKEKSAQAPVFTPQSITGIIHSIEQKANEMGLNANELELLKVVLLRAITGLGNAPSLTPNISSSTKARPTAALSLPFSSTITRPTTKAATKTTKRAETSSQPPTTTYTASKIHSSSSTPVHTTEPKSESAVLSQQFVKSTPTTVKTAKASQSPVVSTRSTAHASTVTSQPRENEDMDLTRVLEAEEKEMARKDGDGVDILTKPTPHESEKEILENETRSSTTRPILTPHITNETGNESETKMKTMTQERTTKSNAGTVTPGTTFTTKTQLTEGIEMVSSVTPHYTKAAASPTKPQAMAITMTTHAEPGIESTSTTSADGLWVESPTTGDGITEMRATEKPEKATEPHEQTTEPHEQTTKPLEHSSKPSKHSTTPHEHSTTPHGHSTEPHEHTTVPTEDTKEPHDHTTELPEHSTTEPHEHSTEAHEHSTKPNEYSTEPHEHSTEPHEHSMKPHEHSTEPHEHFTEPHEHSTEPHEHSTEPHEHSTEPHHDHTTVPTESTTEPHESEEDELVRELIPHVPKADEILYDTDSNDENNDLNKEKEYNFPKKTLSLEDELNEARELQTELRQNQPNGRSHSRKRILDDFESADAKQAQLIESELRQAKPVKPVKTQNRESSDASSLENELLELGG